MSRGLPASHPCGDRIREFQSLLPLRFSHRRIQVLRSEAFGTFHRTACPTNVEPPDLLLCIGIVVAGFLIIDPFGVNGSLLHVLLWLVPAIITWHASRGQYVTALQVEEDSLVASAFIKKVLTSKWSDYWLTALGIRLLAFLFKYVQRLLLGGKEAKGISMFILQSALLMWWITSNDTTSCTFPSPDPPTEEGEASDRAPQVKMALTSVNTVKDLGSGSNAANPDPHSQVSSNLLDSLSIDSSLHGKAEYSSPPIPSAVIEPASRSPADPQKTDVTVVNSKTQLAAVPFAGRSPLSDSSEGTIPHDGESVYSSGSDYETDASATWPSRTPSTGTEGLAVSIRPKSNAYPSSYPTEEKEPFHLAISDKAVTIQQKAPCADNLLSSKPSDPAVSKESYVAGPGRGQYAMEVPPRTSRILAQLDDLLVTEMEAVSPHSLKANSSTNSRSNTLPPETPLDVRRLVLRADQKLLPGKENHTTVAAKVIGEKQATASRLKKVSLIAKHFDQRTDIPGRSGR